MTTDTCPMQRPPQTSGRDSASRTSAIAWSNAVLRLLLRGLKLAPPPEPKPRRERRELGPVAPPHQLELRRPA